MADVAMVVSNRYEPDPRVQKEAASLVAAGHRVRVYAFDRLEEMATQRERIDGVEVHRLQLGRYQYGAPVAAALGLRRFLSAVRKELLREPPDVLHCHDQDTCALGTWFQSQRTRGRRRGLFVFDAHDFYWTYPLMADRASLPRRVASSLLKLAAFRYARRADLLITVSESVGVHPGYAEVYRGWGADPVVLWNAPMPVSARPPLPPEFTVGYYGNVRELSMFRWLMAAIEALPADQRPALRVAGGGIEQARVQAFLEAETKRLGVPLHMTGFFDVKDLGALMAQCSVQFCMYPLGSGNVVRTIPVKLFDAVAHGRLGIGNADTLMADFIERNDWGWVVSEGDVAGLATALAQARARLAGRSEPPALTPPPSWQEQADKLCQAYERLLRAR
jgi:glycosyltransferase involved in cell wall biosynthesis